MIASPNLSDKDVQKLAEDTRELLKGYGADTVTPERVERRALAYPVKKLTEAYYLYISFSGPATIPEKVRFDLRHREGLMRMTFVCKPLPAPEPAPQPAPAPAPAPAEPAPEVAGG
jgi:ribosomal protein S6